MAEPFSKGLLPGLGEFGHDVLAGEHLGAEFPAVLVGGEGRFVA